MSRSEVELVGYVTKEKHLSERIIGTGGGGIHADGDDSRIRTGVHHRVRDGYNTERDGTSMTIKANYWKVSASNFMRQKDWGATGVIEYDEG